MTVYNGWNCAFKGGPPVFTEEGVMRMLEEARVETAGQIYQALIDRGIPESASDILKIGNSAQLDELARRYETGVKKGLPIIAAASIALHKGSFWHTEGGLDKVVANYHDLRRSFTEIEAAQRACQLKYF